MPDDITKQAFSSSVVVEWTEPMATDNSGIQSMTSSHKFGSMFRIGSTSIVYTSTDPSGNTEMLAFLVIIKGKFVVVVVVVVVVVIVIVIVVVVCFVLFCFLHLLCFPQ